MIDFEIKQTNKIKKIKKIALLCLAISVIALSWALLIYINTDKEVIDFQDYIVNYDNSKQKIVTLKISQIPYRFAEFNENSYGNKFYFLTNGDYVYIGYLDHKTYNYLNRKSITEKPLTIKGITKPITSDIVDLAIEVYNKENNEEILTNNNFSQYFGENYIDTVSPKINNSVQLLIGIIILIVDLLLFIIYLFEKKTLNKIINREDYKKIKKELNYGDTKYYDEFNLYLTKSYIIDTSKDINIILYSDIIWIYTHQKTNNEISKDHYLVITLKNNKKENIAKTDKEYSIKDDIYSEILSQISKKNLNILIGYTEENKNKINDLLKNKE